MEYQTNDHLGNTRLVYADLDNDGIINTPSEILDEVHYYPNGLKMEGYWMNSQRFRYTFNGIEEVNDFGLNVNMAMYRTLDPELGRWWNVDPDATMFGGLSPYNSMLNSPKVHNDPNGDNPILIGAGIGLIQNGINNLSNGQNFFHRGAKASIIGGAQGGISAGIGGGANALSANLGPLGVGLYQAGAHGLTAGVFSSMGGGNFGSGFLSGVASSGVSSLVGSDNPFIQIAAGGLSGGLGSVAGGGSFLDGFGQGLITSGLNHAAHSILSGGGPPWEYNGESYSSKESLLMAILIDESFNQFGIKDLAAVGGILVGANIIPTRGKLGGAIPRTSVASILARKIPGNFPFSVPTLIGFPRIGKGLRTRWVKNIGTFVGRGIPVIGWGILAYDASMITYRTYQTYNSMVNE
ncbi:MAG: hypothetical protein AAF960_01045 [Bacteroidota bacterium]